MTAIEHARQQKDLLYHLIVNASATTLDEVCVQIKDLLYQTYDEQKMSTRLKQMLTKVCESEDRVAKHAFLFYALCQEPNTQNIFMTDTPRVPPDKFKRFVSNELPTLVDKLVRGAFTSLRAFVEDARWAYTTL